MLDRLVKISSLSGAFLIFCGVLKLIIYYSAFNITIVDFLSFSEIITSFLDDINILLIYAAIMIVITFSTINFIHRQTKVVIDDIVTALLKFLFPHRYKYVLFFFIITSIISILLYLDVIGYNYFIVYVLVFCLIQMLSYMLMTKVENDEIDIPNFSKALIIGLCVTYAIFLLAKHDIQVAKKYEYSTTIQTQEVTYVCDQTTKNIYLGKTDSFLFVKLDSSGSTLSIPVSSIKSINFK